jgi:hypothetical protein
MLANVGIKKPIKLGLAALQAGALKRDFASERSVLKMRTFACNVAFYFLQRCNHKNRG